MAHLGLRSPNLLEPPTCVMPQVLPSPDFSPEEAVRVQLEALQVRRHLAWKPRHMLKAAAPV